MKQSFEQPSEAGEIDREVSLDYQLEVIADRLGEFKDKGMLDKEAIGKFNVQVDTIKSMEDKTERENEKAALLQSYRKLIKSLEKQP